MNKAINTIRRTAAVITVAIGMAAPAHMQAQSDINNPVTRAVLDAYTAQINENPNDYQTLLDRANEYYRHNEYIRALDDVNRALECTPVKESAIRFQEYMLRAGIYEQSHKTDLALADLTEACNIDPRNYVALYQKANAHFTLGQIREAKDSFTRMLGVNQRGTEAYIGLARVAVKENNPGMANEYLEKAVSLDPNNAELYLRRASVRKMMGNDNGAVDDLLLALSTDPENGKAIDQLVDYGNTNYTATMVGLTNAIAQAPRQGMFYYLRAVISQAHYHYQAAIRDYETIIKERLYNYHGLYASMGECQYCLGRYDEALTNIDYALGSVSDNPHYFVLRAKVLRALGRTDDAITACTRATAINPNYSKALTEMGLCYYDKGDYKQAASLFGEATLNDTEDPYCYMLRAWVLEEKLNQPVAASQFYEHVAGMDKFFIDNVKSLKGFALYFMGRTDEADRWFENIGNTVTDHDGLINYYRACYECAKGNIDAALEYASKSLDNGYADYYNWSKNTDARINVAPLRDDLRFLNLLSRHSLMFESNN